MDNIQIPKPVAKTTTKKTSNLSHEEQCCALVWSKPYKNKHGARCSRRKTGGSDFCSIHGKKLVDMKVPKYIRLQEDKFVVSHTGRRIDREIISYVVSFIK